MKSTLFLFIILQFCLPILTIQALDLQKLEVERELHNLVKIKLHGDPLVLPQTYNAKSIAFSPDGKYLAVSLAKGVAIYDLVAEQAKRSDKEMEKLRAEVKKSKVDNA